MAVVEVTSITVRAAVIVITAVPCIAVIFAEVAVISVRAAVPVISVIGVIIAVTLVSDLILTGISPGLSCIDTAGGVVSVVCSVHFISLSSQFRS